MDISTFSLAFGSNLSAQYGSPVEIVQEAVRRLVVAGCVVTKISKFYGSAAFPPGSGPDFVNGCLMLEASLSPEELLVVLHRIEAELGRIRSARWQPRCIDLDLIACGGKVLPNLKILSHWIKLPPGEQVKQTPDGLLLPHPRLQDRGFVLIPLAEIAPDWHHPVTGLSVTEMVDALSEAEKKAVWPLTSVFAGG